MKVDVHKAEPIQTEDGLLNGTAKIDFSGSQLEGWLEKMNMWV